MEHFLEQILAAFWPAEIKYIILVFALLAFLLRKLLPAERQRIRTTTVLFVVSLGGQLAGAVIGALAYTKLASIIYETFVISAGFAFLRLIGLFCFRIFLPKIGVNVVNIAEDIVLFIAYGMFVLGRLHILGLNPSSLLTTSAVITAVLAFAMQDTLGNVLSGVALHLDNSLQKGDWIRIDDIAGKVLQIRWRQTSLWTRNGEIVVIPNGQLMKGRFTVFARADEPEMHWRRWVWFNVTYASPPMRVIEKAQKAIRTADIPNVADNPPPSCVLMEFGPGYARYALRYWMIDPLPDDPTDSAVRLHLFASLQRAGMKLAAPEQTLHVIKEGSASRESSRRTEIERRIADLHGVEIFSRLKDEELWTIGERMIYAPFPKGSVIFVQGQKAHWLYLLVNGEAEVLVDVPAHGRQVLRTLAAGQVFGIRGAMTGERRHDTVIAKTDVVCYRLDQASVQDIIRSRPELADEFAEILSRQEGELAEFFRRFDSAPISMPTPPKSGMLETIRNYLNL